MYQAASGAAGTGRYGIASSTMNSTIFDGGMSPEVQPPFGHRITQGVGRRSLHGLTIPAVVVGAGAISRIVSASYSACDDSWTVNFAIGTVVHETSEPSLADKGCFVLREVLLDYLHFCVCGFQRRGNGGQVDDGGAGADKAVATVFRSLL